MTTLIVIIDPTTVTDRSEQGDAHPITWLSSWRSVEEREVGSYHLGDQDNDWENCRDLPRDGGSSQTLDCQVENLHGVQNRSSDVSDVQLASSVTVAHGRGSKHYSEYMSCHF